MSELLNILRTTTLAFLLLPFIFTLTTAQKVDLLSMEWHGPNLVLKFSDAVSYQHDLAESDSSLAIEFSTPINLRGKATSDHNGMSAKFDTATGYFTLRGKNRIGYSTLWGPYSHALVIYTFDWDELTPAEEEFHHGLIAMERGFPDLAGEYLSTARGMDTGVTARRAESVLGVLYERQGSDSLAKLYLGDPRDADTWGARAALLRRSGDTVAATTAERELAEARSKGVPGLADADIDRDAPETADSPESLLSSGKGIGLLIVTAILIIFIATMFARRPPASEARKRAESLDHGHAHPPVTEVQPTEETETTVPPPSPEAEAEVERTPPELPVTGETATPPSSRQADELRAKVMGESREESDLEAASVPETEKEDDPVSFKQDQKSSEPETSDADASTESTIEQARRMNLSRDHIELRERLNRKRREDEG